MPHSKDLDKLAQIHFIDLVGKKIPDFEVDPRKVYQVKIKPPKDVDPSVLQPTFRYIVALRGPGQKKAFHDLEDIVNRAKDRLHDRILLFPSGRGNGIFGLGVDYRGAAIHILNLGKEREEGNTPRAFTDKEEKRIDRVAHAIKGDDHHHYKILVIRGSFESKEKFVEALNKALDHPHEPTLPHLLPLFSSGEIVKTVGTALTHAGDGLEGITPNVPILRYAPEALRAVGHRIDILGDQLSERHLHPVAKNSRSR